MFYICKKLFCINKEKMIMPIAKSKQAIHKEVQIANKSGENPMIREMQIKSWNPIFYLPYQQTIF